MIDVIKNNMLKEDNLSENATKSSESIRLKEDKDDINDMRDYHTIKY